MAESDPIEFEGKRSYFEQLASYDFDLDGFLEKTKQSADEQGKSLLDHIRDMHASWHGKVKRLTAMGAMHVTTLPTWHQRLHEEIEIQRLMRDGGHDVASDPDCERSVGLVYGYWVDQIIDITNPSL